MKKIAYVGIDYHLSFLMVAMMIEGNREPDEMVRLKNDDKVIRKYMSKLSEQLRSKHAMKPRPMDIASSVKWLLGGTPAM